MLTFLMLVSVAVTVKLSSLSALVMLSVSFDLNSEMTGAVLSMVRVMVWLVFSPSPIVALSIRVQLPSATQPRLDGVEVNHQILFEDCVRLVPFRLTKSVPASTVVTTAEKFTVFADLVMFSVALEFSAVTLGGLNLTVNLVEFAGLPKLK